MGTRILLFTSIACLLLASCATTNKVAYLQHSQDTTFKKTLAVVEAPLQKNDFISIAISSLNADASLEFNRIANANGEKTANDKKASQFVGYLIDANGNIEIPLLGVIQAAGLTKMQLKEKITSDILAKKLLVQPIVDIRYLNFEVTILGEVAQPSVITVPSEKISMLKALGMAGDMTIYGKRDNVLLIREEDGVRKTRRIDLTSADFLNSDYYYLKPNDVVYVEPNKAKVAVSGRSQQLIPVVLTGASLIFLVLDKVIK